MRNIYRIGTFRYAASIVLAFAAFAVASVHGQPNTVQEQFAARKYDQAAQELASIRKADPKLFDLNNFDYLLARIDEVRGDFAAAAAGYSAVAARGSVLTPYALWHLAAIARAGGNLPAERLFLSELIAKFPDSLLAEAARLRLARSFFESRDYDETIRRLAAIGFPGTTNRQSVRNDARIRENLVLLGKAQLQGGKIADARATFQGLIDNLKNPAQPDDFALAAVIELDRLDAGTEFGVKAPELTELIHLQRAQIYQFNRDFTDARLHYRAIAERFPASGFVPDALFQIGRGFQQGGGHREAIDWFRRVLERSPEHQSARDALLQSASSEARLGNAKQAVALYQQFIERYPDDERLDRAHLNIVDVLRDSGDIAGALEWAAKTQERFRGKAPEAVAKFAQLRIRISQNDWGSALADADALLVLPDLGSRAPGGTTPAEVRFLKALCLENLSRFPEAIETYLSIPDGRSEYYGWRATEHLRSIAASESGKSAAATRIALLRQSSSREIDTANAEQVRVAAQALYRMTGDGNVLETIRKCYEKLEAYRQVPVFKLQEFGRRTMLKPEDKNPGTIAGELLFLGLYDEGTPELERELRAKTADLDQNVLFTLATFYRLGDGAYRSVAFIEPIWRKIPADYEIELIPPDQAALLYPVPFANSLLKYAPPRGVDPRFVLSIMRQESRYRPDVKSVAAARGLMQFIATTSNRIAAELGRSNFAQDDLYDPPTAVLFGSKYLANIYGQMPGQHAAVAASYNGGEDNVLRWMARAGSDSADRYLPEVIFSQSKDYAWKVMSNFRMYQYLYDESLRPKRPRR